MDQVNLKWSTVLSFIVTEMKKFKRSVTSEAVNDENGVSKWQEMQEEFAEELDEGLVRKTTTIDDFQITCTER